MARALTKAQMGEQLAALRLENATLRAQLEAVRAQTARPAPAPADVERRFPLTDYRGRRYRIEMQRGSRVKCFAPGC